MELLLTSNTKTFVYFNKIKLYGTDLICNMMKANGLIEHGETPTSTTLCFKCKHAYREHESQSMIQEQGEERG
jgi:hypothetical protein